LVSIIRKAFLMTKHLKQVKDKFPYMIFFSLLFMILGWFIPYMYYKYIDKRIYFYYYSVNTTRQEYKLCDIATIHIYRYSEINSHGTISLQLLEKDDHRIVHQHISFEVPITSGSKEFDDSTFRLPCDGLKPGIYFYEGSLKYYVSGVPRTANFITNYFNITN